LYHIIPERVFDNRRCASCDFPNQIFPLHQIRLVNTSLYYAAAVSVTGKFGTSAHGNIVNKLIEFSREMPQALLYDMVCIQISD
jgi:hypothetical protein